MSNLRELIETRIDGNDRAITLLREIQTRFPSEADKGIEHLKELAEEKFNSIQVQFKERDTRTEQSSKDSKVAVDAALQAAKEAVSEQNKSNALSASKSEAATTKLIDQLSVNAVLSSKAADDKIGDLKDRLTLIEGRTVGLDKAAHKSTDSSSFYVSIAAVLIALLAGVGGLVTTFTLHYPPVPTPTVYVQLHS
jgi:cation transport regulator ChaB